MRIQKPHLEKHKKANREKWLAHEENYRKSIIFGEKVDIDTIQYIL